MSDKPAGDDGRWDRVAAMPEFRRLLAAKKRFIVPAAAFFLIYYFALPALVGYAPTLMAKKVLGPLNLAYLFALSQFFMAWTLALLYVRAAARFDRMNEEMLRKRHEADERANREEEAS